MYQRLLPLFVLIITVTCEDIVTNQLGIPIEVPPSKRGVQIFNVLYPPQFSTSNVKPEATASSCHCASDQWYIIRNPTSELVVQGNSDSEVVIEYNTGRDKQLWQFEPVGPPGWYYIVNKQTGNVLDVMLGSKKVITKEKSGSESQQWLVEPDGGIYNKDRRENLDIKDANFRAKNTLQVVKKNTYYGHAQEFSLHLEDTRRAVGKHSTEIDHSMGIYYN